eukprot:ANDGO_02960.mRNA.1 hypothetical protein
MNDDIEYPETRPAPVVKRPNHLFTSTSSPFARSSLLAPLESTPNRQHGSGNSNSSADSADHSRVRPMAGIQPAPDRSTYPLTSLSPVPKTAATTPSTFRSPQHPHPAYYSRSSPDDGREVGIGSLLVFQLCCLSVVQAVRQVASCYMICGGALFAPWSPFTFGVSLLNALLCFVALVHERDADACDRPVVAFLVFSLLYSVLLVCFYGFRRLVQRKMLDASQSKRPAVLDSAAFRSGLPLAIWLYCVFSSAIVMIGGAICLFSTWNCSDKRPVSYYVLYIVWIQTTAVMGSFVVGGVLWFCSGLPEDMTDLDEMAQVDSA